MFLDLTPYVVGSKLTRDKNFRRNRMVALNLKTSNADCVFVLGGCSSFVYKNANAKMTMGRLIGNIVNNWQIAG